MSIKIGIVGGDLRYGYLANALARRGFAVTITALDCGLAHPPYVRRERDYIKLIEESDALLLPTPVCTEGLYLNTPFCRDKILLEQALSHIGAGAAVMGGVVTQTVREKAEECKVNIIDLMKREELAIANAVPTAEGAIAIAMEETVGTIFGSECVVIGYGRIGRALASRLKALGARVTVTARRPEDIAWISADGYAFCPTSELVRVAPRGNIFFNTVPAMVMDMKVLDAIDSDALIVDLASKPGGVDLDFARDAGIKTIWALSLPGKVAPKFAGECIVDTIVNLMRERGAEI